MNSHALQLGKIAGSAAILDKGRILLLRRTERASTFPGHWTFPSGGIEETDSSVRDTVIREVKEETNIDFLPNRRWNFYESTANGKRYFALIHLGEWSGEIRAQETEVAEWGFFTYKETLALQLAFAYREVLDDLYSAKLIS